MNFCNKYYCLVRMIYIHILRRLKPTAFLSLMIVLAAVWAFWPRPNILQRVLRQNFMSCSSINWKNISISFQLKRAGGIHKIPKQLPNNCSTFLCWNMIWILPEFIDFINKVIFNLGGHTLTFANAFALCYANIETLAFMGEWQIFNIGKSKLEFACRSSGHLWTIFMRKKWFDICQKKSDIWTTFSYLANKKSLS